MKTLLISLAVVLYFVGCKDNTITDDRNKTTDVLMPLSVGNFWISKRDFLDSNGVVKDTNYDTLIIVRDTLIANTKWYVSMKYSYIRNGTNGLYVYDKLTNTQNLLFQFPAKVNDSILIDAINKQYCKLLSTSDTVIVGDKNYITYSYKWYHSEPIDDDRTWIDFIKIAPNIGTVSVENIVLDRTSGSKRFWQKSNLISFNIK